MLVFRDLGEWDSSLVRYRTSQRSPNGNRRWFGHNDGSASSAEVRQASKLQSNGVSIDDFDLDDDGSFEREEVRHAFTAGGQAALVEVQRGW